MALCLNPQCQKRVPSKSASCLYCGGDAIGEFNSYSKAEALEDELTIENFHKVVKNTQPFVERTVLPNSGKVSFSSKIAVRVQYLRRKLFFKR